VHVADIDDLAFDPISRDTVSSQIREQLFGRISTGSLAPGEKMPSERDLADQFHVARTSVREAIQGLLSIGVVERRGNRTFVAEHMPDVLMDDPNSRRGFVTELFETRRVLEVPIFRLAAERANSDARAKVAELASAFRDDLDIADFRRLDREFHTTVAAACGNPLLIELYGKVLDQLFRSHDFDAMLSAETNRSEVRRIVADSCAAHRAIATAFAASDIDAVGRCAADHVGAVEHALVDDLV
jgi:GntR family transcriptional repressor for pyruvate dehydrogenase complex